jgi:hypothetical protein
MTDKNPDSIPPLVHFFPEERKNGWETRTLSLLEGLDLFWRSCARELPVVTQRLLEQHPGKTLLNLTLVCEGMRMAPDHFQIPLKDALSTIPGLRFPVSLPLNLTTLSQYRALLGSFPDPYHPWDTAMKDLVLNRHDAWVAQFPQAHADVSKAQRL